MPKWNGGVIGVANNPTQSSAKGIWSLSEATKAIRAGLWPPSNAGADPYFENVTLLLPSDGTNGAQNNTFLDSSTNNFTITRNGNTTQGTFTPFSKPNGRWSNYFDGTGDNLTSTHPALNATFTIEAWIYRTSGSANQSIVHLNNGGVSGVIVYLDGSNYLVCTDGVNGQSAFSNLTVPINAWTHVAVVRSGGTTTGYVNGTVAGSHSFTPATVSAANIGAYNGSLYFPGYISNVRVVNGSAVYTAAFTPPTAPLTAITNTSLLTCQSNRFIDNSTNAFAITRNGDVAAQTFSPFPTLTAYAAGTNGGSGYFDGTGDFLTCPNNAAFDFASGDVTLEAWVYLNTISSQTVVAAFATGGTGFTAWSFNINSSGYLLMDTWVSGTEQYITATSNPIPAKQWTHVAYTRASGTSRLFVNGASCSFSGSISQGINSGGNLTSVGSARYTGYENYLNGYISDCRVVKGTAVYTSAFTPPTAPLTAITNTSLLTNFTNGGIIDTSMSNDLETVGNAQISTTQSKFGGASMYFDGTGDYLDARLGPVQVLGGDFTVEMWVYPTTITGSNRTFLFLENGSNSAAFFMYGATGYVGLDISNVATYNLGSTAITTNSWQHLAFVRSGSTLTAYINGTSVGTATVTASLGSSGIMRIGAGASAGAPYFGYFDEMRVTKGYARYTANFTAPVGPFNGFGD
jgi:hypothetical protein